MVVDGVLRVHSRSGIPKLFKVLCQAVDAIHLIQLIGDFAQSNKGRCRSGQKFEFGVRRSATGDRSEHGAANNCVGKRVVECGAGVPGRLELLKARKVAKTLIHDGNNRRLDFIELGNGRRALLARAIRAVVGGGELLLDALRLIGRIVFGLLNGQLVDHFGERSDKTLRRIRGDGLPTVKSKIQRLLQVDAGKAREPHNGH